MASIVAVGTVTMGLTLVPQHLQPAGAAASWNVAPTPGSGTLTATTCVTS